MPEYLPLFPLSTVVFPQDTLNLHIFEPRYRQLIRDCHQQGRTFGIPPFLDNHLQEMGMEMELTDIVQVYDDGRMDVRTKARRLFRVESFRNPWPGKLHAGGMVEWCEVSDHAPLAHRILLLRHVAEFYDVMGISLAYQPDEAFLSFKVGHKVGLSTRQEYALLSIASEQDRIAFLVDHLVRNTPVVREAERTRQRIRMNGHFQNFDPLDF